MARHSAKPIRTYSVGFREKAYSELDHARTIAKLFGTDHNELIVEPNEFLAHWPVAVTRWGAPVINASDIPVFMLSKAASSAVKVVLTGEGSDELLGGYPKHRAEAWIGLYQKLVPQFVHDQVVAPLVKRLPYGMRRVKIAAGAAGERDIVNRMRFWFGITQASAQEVFGREFAMQPPDLHPFSVVAGSDVRRALFFDQTSWLPDNLLERGDRMMMAGSIEGRMPFMDTELAKLVARFPDRFLIGCTGGKAVLRETMKTVLPAHIFGSQKGRIPRSVRRMVQGAVSRSVARPAGKRRLANRAFLQTPCSAAACGRTSGPAAEPPANVVVVGEFGDLPQNVQAGGPGGNLLEGRLARPIAAHKTAATPIFRPRRRLLPGGRDR
jgi:asparagine synthase (glutamine-hydrolysing)